MLKAPVERDPNPPLIGPSKRDLSLGVHPQAQLTPLILAEESNERQTPLASVWGWQHKSLLTVT